MKRVRIKMLTPVVCAIDVSELSVEEAFKLGLELGRLHTVSYTVMEVDDSQVIEEPTIERLAGHVAYITISQSWTMPGEA